MSFETILARIEKEKVMAQTDLDTVSPRALPYKKGQVQRAKENLEELYIEYKNQLLNNAVFILVTGQNSKEFANIAKENFDCFSVDGKVFYKDIVSELSPELYLNKDLNASVFDVANNILENKMKNLDVTAYNSLMFSSKYARFIKTKGEMLDVITRAVDDNVGSEIIGYDAIERVTREAVNIGYSKRLVPILIHTRDAEHLIGLNNGLVKVNPRIIRLLAGKAESDLDINPLATIEDVSEKSVGEALSKIASKA